MNATGTANGDAAVTTFALPFEFLESANVKVEQYVSGAWSTKTEGTDYHVIDKTVEFVSAPPSGTDNVRFSRVTGRSESYDAPTASPGSPAVMENMRQAASIAARALFVAQEVEDSTAFVLSFDAKNWVEGATSAAVKHGQTDTATVGMAVPVGCVARTASVVAYHNSSSDPGDWTLHLQKNASESDDATFTVEMANSASTQHVTAGDLSNSVSLSSGDRLKLTIDGPSTVGVIFQITLGFSLV